jgi:hypothetical protein
MMGAMQDEHTGADEHGPGGDREQTFPGSRIHLRPVSSHALVPREDALPEDRDIQFICLQCRHTKAERRRTGQPVAYCATDFPADEIQDWGETHKRYGGGPYQVGAKDRIRAVVREERSASLQRRLTAEPAPVSGTAKFAAGAAPQAEAAPPTSGTRCAACCAAARRAVEAEKVHRGLRLASDATVASTCTQRPLPDCPGASARVRACRSRSEPLGAPPQNGAHRAGWVGETLSPSAPPPMFTSAQTPPPRATGSRSRRLLGFAHHPAQNVAHAHGAPVMSELSDLDIDRVAERVVAKLLPHLGGASGAPARPAPPQRLSKAELAQALRRTPATVDRWVALGMPCENMGSYRLFDLDACRAWVAARPRKAATKPAPAPTRPPVAATPPPGVELRTRRIA